MVQVERPFGYHGGVEEAPETFLPSLVADAVREFTGAFGESSRQLAEAADRFVAVSVRHVDETGVRAEKAALASNEMALAARQAADEARGAAESLAQAVVRAGERLREETDQAIERARQELQQKFDELAARAESTDFDNSAATSARQAAEEARLAAARAERDAGSVNLAMASAREAAESSHQAAAPAPGAEARLGPGSGPEDLLERLEADYQLLTTLVQELHLRIGSLNSPATPSGAAAMPVAANHEWQQSAATKNPADWTQAFPGAVLEEQPAQPTLAQTLSGQVQLGIWPVPDFDPLLNLDGALSKLSAVHSVSLADYAQEEVTFRLELTGSVSPQDFARQLAELASLSLEVSEAGDDYLKLRILQ
jgi:hypothetical protein